MLAVGVAGEASPAGTRGETHLERRVDALQAAQDALVFGPAEPVADKLEEFGRDGAFRRLPIRIGTQSQVLPRRQRAPRLDAVLPVVGHRAKMTCGNVL